MPRVQPRIYFDNASTTALHPEILRVYEKLLESSFANSESLYAEGTKVHDQMETARAAIAGLLGCRPGEVIFTSGASEANSMALKGVPWAVPEKKHIITTQIEHSSVLHAAEQMERVFGWEVTYLPVSGQGVIRLEDLADALRPDTVLVSIMAVNNETGAVNPIEEAAEIVRHRSQAFFHSDLTQAVGKIPVSVKHLDLASLSAHKIEGLKGSGLLIKKSHVPMEPLISGGEQEFGLRGGTANALADMVLARTLRMALENQKENSAKEKVLKDRMLKGLKEIPGIEINSPENGVPGLINFSYEAIGSEVMQNALNAAGFMVSARSTCESRQTSPSYVLKAMGYSSARAASSIRICFNEYNTAAEVDAFLAAIKEIIARYGHI